GASATPQTPRPRRMQKGNANTPTAKYQWAIATLGPQTGRAQRWPEGCWLSITPFASAEETRAWGGLAAEEQPNFVN
ncbi:hypothetical protein, partial [Comamonas sp.]|uniref:hypothetical protein n=1 Tax=Comamonas sp. TaxID=34028 RepID=UPI003D0D035C